MPMKDRIRDILKKEKEIDKKIAELEHVLETESDPRVKADVTRTVIEELKKELLESHYDSLTDDLTGFANNKAINEVYNKRLLHSLKRKQCLSLILLDIDGLKGYNDRFGHLAGTELIKNFSIAVTKSIRKSDIASRYGGDEFLIITITTDADGVKNIVDRIDENIAKIKTVGDVKASASIGVAICKGNDESFEELFIEADKKLYKVKEARKK